MCPSIEARFALAFAGGSDRLGVRPSTAAALLIVIAIGALSSNVRHIEIVYAVVTIVWINVHPSALLAPVIALLFERWLTAGISAVARHTQRWRRLARLVEKLLLDEA